MSLRYFDGFVGHDRHDELGVRLQPVDWCAPGLFCVMYHHYLYRCGFTGATSGIFAWRALFGDDGLPLLYASRRQFDGLVGHDKHAVLGFGHGHVNHDELGL